MRGAINHPSGVARCNKRLPAASPQLADFHLQQRRCLSKQTHPISRPGQHPSQHAQGSLSRPPSPSVLCKAAISAPVVTAPIVTAVISGNLSPELLSFSIAAATAYTAVCFGLVSAATSVHTHCITWSSPFAPPCRRPYRGLHVLDTWPH